MKPAALYLRVSAGEPTVQNQRRDREGDVSQRGGTVIAIYNDDGISGTKGHVESSLG